MNGEKTIFDKVKSFQFDKNKSKVFAIKSGIVWGNSKTTNGQFPLLYISKPKNISEDEFQELLDSLDINFSVK